MTHRECLRKVLAGAVTDRVLNYELGCWGQTVERWLSEIKKRYEPSAPVRYPFWWGEQVRL